MRPIFQLRCDDPAPAQPAPNAGYELPATEAAVFELLGWLHTDPVPMDDLSRIIGREPGLAASVLRAATDGAAPWVDSLASALVLLGGAGLQRLALSTPLLNQRERRHQRMCQLVTRSRRAAYLSLCLANECDWPEPELAYLSGLLLELERAGGIERVGLPGGDLGGANAKIRAMTAELNGKVL